MVRPPPYQHDHKQHETIAEQTDTVTEVFHHVSPLGGLHVQGRCFSAATSG